MREAIFIRRNRAKWVEYEHTATMLSSTGADRLAKIYNDLTADLAYCQTHYPNSDITKYLNSLAMTFHNEIYSGRLGGWQDLKRFFTVTMPRLVYGARKALLLSLIVAVVAILIGVYSTVVEPEYAQYVMGWGYIDMTLDNIERGAPAGVYADDPPLIMWLEIMLNNVRVSFNCFAMGVMTSIMPVYMVFINFVSIGAFSVFLYEHDVLGTFSLAMWYHGTLEMSAIVIMGGAGIHMGNGWLFPGTYGRLVSFGKAAREAVMMVLGTMPMIVVASVIEGFLTRTAGVHPVVTLTVIALSLAYVLFYYIYWPYKIHRDESEG